MANIAAQRIKREFKEVIKSEEVMPELTLWTHTVLGLKFFVIPGKKDTNKSLCDIYVW